MCSADEHRQSANKAKSQGNVRNVFFSKLFGRILLGEIGSYCDWRKLRD